MAVRCSIRSIILTVFFCASAIIGFAQTTELSDLLTAGKRQNHPIGFYFRYPPDWTVQDSGGGLSLIPPDAESEAYVILTEEIQRGIMQPRSAFCRSNRQ